MVTTPRVPAIPTHPSSYACIDLVNSKFSDYLGVGPGHDRLPLRSWQEWFLRRYDLPVNRRDSTPLRSLRRLRDELRGILEEWGEGGVLSSASVRSLDRWIGAPSLRRRVVSDRGTPQLSIRPSRQDWAWVMASIAASAVELMAATSPQRVKRCANPDCSWMFHDETLNASRRFCSGEPCGNLMRVREFRRRRRGPE